MLRLFPPPRPLTSIIHSAFSIIALSSHLKQYPKDESSNFIKRFHFLRKSILERIWYEFIENVTLFKKELPFLFSLSILMWRVDSKFQKEWVHLDARTFELHTYHLCRVHWIYRPS